jgi:hypothetical protein
MFPIFLYSFIDYFSLTLNAICSIPGSPLVKLLLIVRLNPGGFSGTGGGFVLSKSAEGLPPFIPLNDEVEGFALLGN